MNDILNVQILDYQDSPASIFANFWWSEERGLTCDQVLLLTLLQEEGITLPNGRVVFPSDGRVFFDALPFGFTGLERAQTPVIVEQQGGQSL
jgi:hypothetical protein